MCIRDSFSPDLIGMTLPFFSVILAFTAEMFNGFRRFHICLVSTCFMNHLLKEFRILKHRAWTQMVVVEWLTVMISHKQWALENLKNGVLMNVCIGEVDEYTRFCITCRVNVEVVTSACNTSADIFARCV